MLPVNMQHPLSGDLRSISRSEGATASSRTNQQAVPTASDLLQELPLVGVEEDLDIGLYGANGKFLSDPASLHTLAEQAREAVSGGDFWEKERVHISPDIPGALAEALKNLPEQLAKVLDVVRNSPHANSPTQLAFEDKARSQVLADTGERLIFHTKMLNAALQSAKEAEAKGDTSTLAKFLPWVERMQDIVADLYSALHSGTEVSGTLIAQNSDGTYNNPGFSISYNGKLVFDHKA
ncbi:hypothetical protein ABID21_003992 [Pseudorhizobium tarimense]|uniref:Uncharacterized protein n=1 Tax=Pseudorhizobium tarimense TaxID=1079109 RepID=A0ABV2HBF9_9HYPH|nr:hypothetical protein [Pseudorhizobium tarimense]MCJ8520764.1 hypothetical protein [Pseudorhizobium tarimense]